jgi:hypothetical protein
MSRYGWTNFGPNEPHRDIIKKETYNRWKLFLDEEHEQKKQKQKQKQKKQKQKQKELNQMQMRQMTNKN